MKATHSSYITQFLSYVQEIEQNMAEAKSNIEFLQVLNKPCEDLNTVESPAEIPEKLPLILNLVRVIWTNSPYYNSKAKITTLCKELSNQIILLCTKYIKIDEILDGKTRMGIKMFETCIECCVKYKHIYFGVGNIFLSCITIVYFIIKNIIFQMSKLHSERSHIEWDLNMAQIFNHIDSFAKRCYDMIEICEAMIVFGRLDETENIIKPLFHTSKGMVFEAMCDKTEKWLHDSIKDIKKVFPIFIFVLNLQYMYLFVQTGF